MPSFREQVIVDVIDEQQGITRVSLDDGSRAYSLDDLTGPVGVGDRVVVNTTAVDLGLGTGGWHVVHWNLTRGAWAHAGPGHLMKLRYTSLQADTGAAEEDGGAVPDDLAGAPVIAAGVHSQLAPIAAAFAATAPGARLAYVMTDGASLPAALSDLVRTLRDRGLICGTVTAGHAFGGDAEALNVPSALVTARHRLGADAIVVCMGPGIAGTGTALGFTGLEAASVLDAAAWLGGRPVACVRWSDADPRPRHRGVSHHTRTVLDAVRSEVDVALSPGIEPWGARHRWYRPDVADPVALLDGARLQVTTMGRTPAQDPGYFAAAAAAGHLAGHAVEGTVPPAIEPPGSS